MSFHHVFLALTPFCPGHVHHRLRRRRGCLALGQLVDRMQKCGLRAGWQADGATGTRGIWWFGRAGFPAGRWLGRDSRIFQLSSSYIVYIDIYIDVYFVFIIVLGMAGFPACSMYPVVTCRRWQYDNWLFSRSGSPEIKCKRRNKFCS